MRRIIIIVELNVILEKCELIGEPIPTSKYWTLEIYVELELI